MRECSKVCLHNSVGAVSPALASRFTSQWESALNPPLSTLDSWYSYGKNI